MSLSRREFLRLLGMAGAAGMIPGIASSKTLNTDIYQTQRFGDVRLLHITDTHAQLLPIYYREPSFNLGIGEALGRPPHLVTGSLLKYYGIFSSSPLAHAFTPVNYVDAAQKYGKVGGFAYLKTLVERFEESSAVPKPFCLTVAIHGKVLEPHSGARGLIWLKSVTCWALML